jgi:hypothetical protein
MTCPNCKNPIQDNSTRCEWCGTEIQTNNTNNPKSYSNNNLNSNTFENKKFNIYFLIPGVIVFLIWVYGNITSQSEKQRLFGQDDISTWLKTSIAFLITGFLLGFLIKNNK